MEVGTKTADQRLDMERENLGEERQKNKNFPLKMNSPVKILEYVDNFI